MKKVSVIGAGNVGATCAFSLFIRGKYEIVLIDKVDGLAKGKALDIAQSKSLWQTKSNISGSSDYNLINDSHVVVITAGLPRKPGMSRRELLEINAEIIDDVTKNVVAYSPNAIIIVVVNPVDTLTYYILKKYGIDSKKIIGMSGMVDSARLKYFASELSSVDIDLIDAKVIGPHSDLMIPLMSDVKSKGEKGKKEKDLLANVADKTKNAGAQIVSYLKKGSAFYTPGSAAAFMAEAVLKDRGFNTQASVLLNGEFGINDVCIGVPVCLGAKGINEIYEDRITEKQLVELKKVVNEQKEINKELPL